MALSGAFSTMPLPEVLGWVGSTNRQGVLTVHWDGAQTMLHLTRGRIDQCTASDPPVLLGQFLLFHGLIDEGDLDRAMRTHALEGRRLGDVLTEIGAIQPESLQEALGAKAEETALGCFDHPDGSFVFEPHDKTLPAPLALDMTISDAIARGTQRVEAGAAAIRDLAQPGQRLRKTAKPPSPKVNSVYPLRNAYGLVDGERTIDEIMLHMHGTRFHVIQRLYQLFKEGFIELAPTREPETLPDFDMIEGDRGTAAHGDATRERLSSTLPNDAIEEFIPIAVPREIARRLDTLSNVEKYLLAQCGGTRSLRSIAAVVPLRTQTVIDAVRSLVDRGFLKSGVGAPD